MSTNSLQIQTVKSQLAAIEQEVPDYAKYISYFAEDGIYQFANFRSHQGHTAIATFFGELLGLFNTDYTRMSIFHDISQFYELENLVFCKMCTVYLMDRVEALRLPCLSLYTFTQNHSSNPEIKYLQVYIDPSPLFADTSHLAAQGKRYAGISKSV
ncbi:MAG: hypothetical protein SFT94_12380 [Pseudanabaenaceae cyanobacterium bins.68]|nr:hypothetical protein [Pseudanabaenaceae cyanobacterium bins.68]